MDIGRQVDHRVDPFQRSLPVGLRSDIGEALQRRARRQSGRFRPSHRGDHLMALRQQSGNEGAADEASGAADEDTAHGAATTPTRAPSPLATASRTPIIWRA